MENNWPKISIITPTFNQGQYIEQTILSVLNQNYPNLEYIIIDGGSTDNTVDIIKKHENKISYWVSEKDKGQSDAINKGLKIATGDIINWLNSDDYYEPNILLKIAETFASTKASCIYGKTRLFDETSPSKGTHKTFVGESLIETLCKPIIDQPSTFFSKEALMVMGELSLKLHYVMDKEWWIKYLFYFQLKSISYVDEFFVNFRFHEDSKTISKANFFPTDHATILYSLAMQKDLNNLSELIAEKFNVDKAYTFTYKFLDKVDASTIERMICWFLLKHSKYIFSETDFNRSKKIYNTIDFNKYSLFEEEKYFLKSLKLRVNYKNWFTFRLLRKLNYFKNR